MIQFTRVEPVEQTQKNPGQLKELGPVFIMPRHVVAVIPMKDHPACHIITTSADWRVTVHGSVEFICNKLKAPPEDEYKWEPPTGMW